MERRRTEARLNPEILLEVCVDSVEGALAAEAGGAGRVELCDDLLEGGTTPGAGMIQVVRGRMKIPIHVMIRPRGGDFRYSEPELEVMRREIKVAGESGAAGVVLGLLRTDGTVDVEATAVLVRLARPMAVTFHRAFDLTPDPLDALEDLIRLGVDRVLTSGQEVTAAQGAALIARLVRQAAGRVIVMAGGGVQAGNAADLVRRTRIGECHASCSSEVPARDVERLSLGRLPSASAQARRITDLEKVRGLVSALRVTRG